MDLTYVNLTDELAEISSFKCSWDPKTPALADENELKPSSTYFFTTNLIPRSSRGFPVLGIISQDC